MNSARLSALLSTVLLVVGALLVGEAIHGGVVTGARPLGSPWVVLRAAVGLAFVALGYRFRTPVEEYVAAPSGGPDRSERKSDESPRSAEESPDAADVGEFDADVSPLGEDGLEHVDAEESSETETTDEK